MSDMSDSELIGYCRIHCETPVGLFHKGMIERLCRLAGAELVLHETWVRPSEEDVKHLCDLATDRIKSNDIKEKT